MPATLNQMRCNGRLPHFADVLLAAVTVVAPRAQADPLGANRRAIFRLDVESAYEQGCFPPCRCPIMHIDDLTTRNLIDLNGLRVGPTLP